MRISKATVTSLLTFGLGNLMLSACSELPPAMADSAAPNPIMGKLKIEMVGYFTAQTVSAVAVSRSGRLFVSLMEPGAHVSTSIGELNHGLISAYPIAASSSLRRGDGLTNESTYVFASVHAIEIDHHNHLWVLNCATDATEARGGPRADAAALVEVNLNDNKALRVISLDSMADVCSASITQLSFRSDDLVAFLGAEGDSAPRFSLNLHTQECLRIASVASPSPDHAASHATAMTCPNAASWMDSGGRLYISVRAPSEPESDRIGSRVRLVAEKDRMHWPAGFGRGPDGALYISAIQVCGHSVGRGDVSPSAVFKISPDMLSIVASAR